MSFDGLSDVFTPLINVEGLMISEGSIHSNTLRYRDIIAIARIKQIRFFFNEAHLLLPTLFNINREKVVGACRRANQTIIWQ